MDILNTTGQRILTLWTGGSLPCQSQEMDTLYTTGQRILTLGTGGSLSCQSQEVDTPYTTGQRLLTLQTGGSGVGGHVAVTGDGVPLLHTAPTVGTGVVLAL